MVMDSVVMLPICTSTMIPGRTEPTKATEEAVFVVQSRDGGCFAHDGDRVGKWCYWSVFLRYVMLV